MEIAPGGRVTHAEFARQTEALIRKVGFAADPATLKLERVEHVTSALPPYAERAFKTLGMPGDAIGNHHCFFGHNGRLRMCNFTSPKGEIYMGVQFRMNAEGPPNSAHGGAIATAIDNAMALLAAHNNEHHCLTKTLNVYYEKPIPLMKLVLIRTWVESRIKNGITAVCDIVDEDLTLYARGTAEFVLFPIPPEQKNDVRYQITLTSFIEKHFTKARLECEAEEDARPEVPFEWAPPIAYPPLVEEVIAKQFAGWKKLSFEEELCDIYDADRHTLVGLHPGVHFDFGEKFGTMIFEHFQNPKNKESGAVVYFSPFAEGPPTYVHGGAIATLSDSFLADAVVFQVGFGRVTKNLSIRYLRPIPVGSVCVFRQFTLTKLRGGVSRTRAVLTDIDGKPYCIASADFKLHRNLLDLSFQQLVQECGRKSTKSKEENRARFIQLMTGNASPALPVGKSISPAEIRPASAL